MNKAKKNLKILGYETKSVEIKKNGVLKQGLQVFLPEDGSNVKVSAVFYPEMFEGMSADEILRNILLTMKNPMIHFSQKSIVKDKVFLGLVENRNSGDLVTEPCPMLPGLNYFMYIQVNESPEYITRINCSNIYRVLDTLGMGSIFELFKAAEENTKAAATCKKLSSVIEDMSGGEIQDQDIEGFELYLLTVKHMSLGAGAIVVTDKLKEVAKACGSDKMVVIPSSVHEVLLFSVPEDATKDCLPWYTMMVREVNAQPDMVRPEDRLCDRAFFLDVSTL